MLSTPILRPCECSQERTERPFNTYSVANDACSNGPRSGAARGMEVIAAALKHSHPAVEPPVSRLAEPRPLLRAQRTFSACSSARQPAPRLVTPRLQFERPRNDRGHGAARREVACLQLPQGPSLPLCMHALASRTFCRADNILCSLLTLLTGRRWRDAWQADATQGGRGHGAHGGERLAAGGNGEARGRTERAQAPCVATMRPVAALAAGPSHASDSSSIDVVARSRTMLAERNRKLRERVQAVRSGTREVVLLSLHGGVTAEPVAPTRRSPRTGPRAGYADETVGQAEAREPNC